MSAKVFTIGGHTLSYGGCIMREIGEGALTITKTVTGTGIDTTTGAAELAQIPSDWK